MQFTTFVLAALASVSTVSASAVENQPRATVTVGLPNGDFNIRKDLAAGINVTSVQAFPVGLPATECTLFWQFQPGFPVSQSGASQVNVFDANGNAPGALVGTFSVGAQDGAQHVINTFQCRNPLTVRFEIASNDQPGSLSFHANAANGIFVKYNTQ